MAIQVPAPFTAPGALSSLGANINALVQRQKEQASIPTDKERQLANALSRARLNMITEQINKMRSPGAIVGINPTTGTPVYLGQAMSQSGDTIAGNEQQGSDVMIPQQQGKSARGAAIGWSNPLTGNIWDLSTPSQRTDAQKAHIAMKQAMPLIGKLIDVGKKGYLGSPSKILQGDDKALYDSLEAEIKEKLLKSMGLPRTNAGLKALGKMIKRGDFETAEAYDKRLTNLIDRMYTDYVDNSELLRKHGIEIPQGIPSKEELIGYYGKPKNNEPKNSRVAASTNPYESEMRRRGLL